MIRIHKMTIVENEHLYGPGKRVLVFLQGCSIHCKGCVNQHLWPFDDGKLISSKEVLNYCKEEKAVGITIHGGEPLDQANGLIELTDLFKKNGLTIILFTGYLKKSLAKNNNGFGAIQIWSLLEDLKFLKET